MPVSLYFLDAYIWMVFFYRRPKHNLLIFYKGLKIYTHIFQNIPYCPEKVHIESFSLYNDIFIPQFQLFQFGTQIIKEDLGIR